MGICVSKKTFQTRLTKLQAQVDYQRQLIDGLKEQRNVDKDSINKIYHKQQQISNCRCQL